MKALFDTNIYIDFLGGRFPKFMYDAYIERFVICLCPVVYHELIRCNRSPKSRQGFEVQAKRLLFLPPPTTPMWIRSGELAAKVLGNRDERSLERIQNDLLIALTARENGAVLITRDKFFSAIQKHIPFRMILIGKMRRATMHREIAGYAVENAGTPFDLDEELSRAAVDELLDGEMP